MMKDWDDNEAARPLVQATRVRYGWQCPWLHPWAYWADVPIVCIWVCAWVHVAAPQLAHGYL